MAVTDVFISQLKPFATELVVAVVIMILGLIFGQLISKLIKKVLSEIELNKIVRKTTGLSLKLESTLSSLTKYFVFLIFLIWALERVGLGSIVLNILAGGIVIVIILAILLGIKDFLPNAVAGMYLKIKGKAKSGDYIRSDSVTGTVVDVDLVETKIETKAKDIIYIPNSMLIKSGVTVLKKKP